MTRDDITLPREAVEKAVKAFEKGCPPTCENDTLREERLGVEGALGVDEFDIYHSWDVAGDEVES